MMDALLRPLVASRRRLTASQVGGRGGIFYLSASAGDLDEPLVTEPKLTHTDDFFFTNLVLKIGCFILRSNKAFNRRVVNVLSIRSAFIAGGKLGLRGRSNRTAHEALLQTPGQ